MAMIMYAGKGVTGLLLVAAFAVAVEETAEFPRSKPSRVYRPNMDQKQLIEHVMLYEEQWMDVLQEPIKGLGEPPYMGRAFAAPQVIKRAAGHENDDKHDNTTVYNVREIVATVVSHYSGIRSFVEYAAKAVRRALSCYTFRRVLFQLSSILLMVTKEADAIVVLTAADALKKNAAAYMDLLAAVPDDDLTALFRLYWEAINVTQYDEIQHLREQQYPKSLIMSVTELSRNLEEYIADQCHSILTNDEFFRQMGIWKKTPLIKDPNLDLLVKIEDLEKMTNDQYTHMSQYGVNLRIVTMPNRLWSTLYFNKGTPPSIKSDLIETASLVENEVIKMSEANPATADPKHGDTTVQIERIQAPADSESPN
ncbi:uncharacterized protein LOC113553540 [Rhopalosiphum maidis]|uniref:uncharacterized protein LOC113553540 n=1 Tax=Rhopalosiphum maidis TaxID=43146 RepID=UPI000F000906|nr:uncharacterized protein LOC113553540 [Rhopalosiphum maidis]